MTRKSLIRIAFFLLVWLLARDTIFGWSSTIPTLDYSIFRVTSNAFATHQFLGQQAYEALKEHPVLRAGFVRFPEFEAIFRHGSIDQSQNGLGPDNPHNSKYSWHWYNPDLKYEPAFGNGLAPTIVSESLFALKNIFKVQGLKTANKPGDGAHEAAYLAHFIQDMTCAFHVVGMPIPASVGPGPIRVYRDNWVKKMMIGGPFKRFSESDWDDVVAHAVEAFAADSKADWFDPNYYDGGWPSAVMNSSHFQYEAAVEVAYMKDAWNHSSRWNALRAAGLLSPLWKRSQPPKDFARLVAEQTLSKYTLSGLDLFPEEKKAKAEVEVPYDDWWRAIQATYTLWRAAFSAMVVLEEDLKLVKLPREKDMYQVQAVIRNLEPESDVEQVSVKYEIPGTRKQNGTGSAARISKSEASDWIPLSGKVYIPDPEIRGNQIFYNGNDTIRVEASGQYQVPDAEELVKEFALRDIRISGTILQDMTGWKRSEVEDYLTTNELEMEVGESAGPAPDPDQEDTVKSQKPLPRAIVAPGDKISVSLYDRYMTKVPNVTKPPLRQHEAVKLIKDCSLEVEEPIGKIEVEPTIPEGVAVEQIPKPDTLVAPGSKVKIRISVHKKPAQQAPGRLGCYASIDIEPQGQWISIDQRLQLRASVTFYDSPNGENKLNVPLESARFEWKLGQQKKEDWPPGEVATLSANGPVATLTPLASGEVYITCSVTNVLNQNLALSQVVIVKTRPEPEETPPEPVQDEAAEEEKEEEPAPERSPEPSPAVTNPPPSSLPPTTPPEESTELEGIWDTTRGIVIDIRRIGGNDYEGTLVRLYTPEKIKYYKVPIGYRMFRARKIGPGEYSCDFMGGIHPKTGEMWFNSYYVLVVKGNKAQVRGGITWIRQVQ